MNPQKRPPRPPVRTGQPQDPPPGFVGIWLAMFVLCGGTHTFIGFATLLAAGDNGRIDSPIYTLYMFAAPLVFALTQVGLFVGGRRLLLRGRPVWQVVALAVVLYSVSLCSLISTDLVPREFFTTGP